MASGADTFTGDPVISTTSNRLGRISPLGWGLPLIAMALAQLGLWAHVSDDAYISFRYVARWVGGEGLTFNPGERVEGFSNPLWVGVLALAKLLSPDVEIADAARALGLFAAVISLAAVGAIVRRSSRSARILALTPRSTGPP